MTAAPESAVLPKAFHRLWAASCISYLGDGVYLAALPLLAASLTRDPFTLGLVASGALLPSLFFSLPGGALVDRWDRRRTMLIADLARGALLAVPAVAMLLGWAGVQLLIVVAFCLGTAQIFFDTASSAYLPQLLDRDVDLLQQATARKFGAQTVASEFVGPPVGSLLFALSRAVPFLANALSFLASGVLIRTLPSQPVTPRTAKASLAAEIREGVAFVVRNRILLASALRFGMGNVAFMAGDAVLVLFARENLHLGNFGYGVLLTAQAVGGLAGTVLARLLGKWLRIGGALILTAGVEAFAQLCLGLSTNAVEGALALIVTGAAMAATMVLGPSISQAIVPPALNGRVSATNRLFAFGSAPLGAALGGYLGSVAGLRAPFLIGAALLAAVTLSTASLAPSREIEAVLAAARARRNPGPVEALAQTGGDDRQEVSSAT